MVDASRKNQTFGALTRMEVDGSPKQIAFLKFNTISFGAVATTPIKSIKLKLTVANPGGMYQEIKYVADASWREETLTYLNKPAIKEKLVGFRAGQIGSVVEVDLTQKLKDKVGGTISFAIDKYWVNGTDFYTKEHANTKYWPALIVTY